MAQHWFRRATPGMQGVRMAAEWEPVADSDVPFDGIVTNQARVLWHDGLRLANVAFFKGYQWARVELNEIELLQAYSHWKLKH